MGQRLDGARHGGHVRREDLLRDSPEHQALVRRAVAVAVAVLVVGVACAAQDKRLVAVERLLARVHVTAGALVVDLHGHVHLDAAERVHHVLEAVEVDLGVMGDGHAGHLRDGLNSAGRTTEGVGRIQLLHAVTLNFRLRIAVERHHGDLLVLRVNAGKDHRVGAERIASIFAFLALLRLIGAHKQHVERASVVVSRLLESLLNLRSNILAEVGLDLVDVGKGHTNAAQSQHEHGGQRAERDALALLAATILGVIAARRRARIGIALRKHGHDIRRDVHAVEGLRRLRPHRLRAARAHRLGMAGVVGRAHRLGKPRIVRLADRLGGMAAALGAGVVAS